MRQPALFLFVIIYAFPNGLLMHNATICISNSCNKTAEDMLKSMNRSANPCEDFYNYACGQWIEDHPIPAEESEVGKFKDLMDTMKYKKLELLENSTSKPFLSELSAKSFYKQCRGKAKTESVKAKPAFEYLEKAMGGWPILAEKWDADKFDLFDALVDFRMHGFEPLFSVYVSPDFEEPSRNVIFLGEANTFASRDVLESDSGQTYLESYIRYMSSATQMFLKDVGAAKHLKDVRMDLEEIMRLGRNLSLFGQTALEKRNLTAFKTKTTLEDFQKNVFFRSRFSGRFIDYVKKVFSNVGLGDKVHSTTKVVMGSTDWFVNLDAKLKEYEDQEDVGKRKMANYIGWRIISENNDYLHKAFRDAFARHEGRIQGKQLKEEKETKSTHERCTSKVASWFPLTLGAMYVRDMVPPNLKKTASTLMVDLKAGFKELLTDADWMDSGTYSLAVNKLSAMMELVGFPDIFTENITAVDDEYRDVKVGETYFGTILDLYKNNAIKRLQRLGKPNVRYDAVDDAFDVTEINAFNSLGKNLIIVLAAVLQPPIFDPDSPQYVNYGGAGFFVGHEITHGFDDQGSSFDDQGMMRTWWSSKTKETYDSKKQRLAEQYSNYSIASGGKVNGHLTLGENIADNGGLKAAFRGYGLSRKRSGKAEPLLPGFEDMSAEKLFFLSTAQIWCTKKRPQLEKLNLLTDMHSPAKFRINGPMSNMPEFSAAFQCPAGSTMNPPAKHSVW